jgi:hypothetical protein
MFGLETMRTGVNQIAAAYPHHAINPNPVPNRQIKPTRVAFEVIGHFVFRRKRER